MTTPFEQVENEAMRDMDLLRANIKKLEQDVNNANHSADMYANAWQRELLQYDGKIRNKHHHIDAMVLSTRALIEMLKKADATVAEAKKAASMLSMVYEIKARRGGWIEADPLSFDNAADWNRRIIYTKKET